jgi:AcrR family transcriptional regulator
MAATRRLTRAESQERTRTLIVQAATRLFLRDGFGVTSLEQIAEEAGFTRGAVYANYEGKTAIGIAVIDELYAREEEKLERILHRAGRHRVLAALASWADETIGDPAWTRLEIEIAASSANDPRYSAATAARYARLRARCAELLHQLLDDADTIDVEMLATAVVGLALGLGAQRAVDRTIPGTILTDTLRAILTR